MRAAAPALLAAFQRDLAARLPAGVEVQVLPVDAPTAGRPLAVAHGE